jgi:predicted nucleotidyltransferase
VQTATINKTSILDILHQHQDEIRSYGVSRIGLFGSYVRNAQHELSDIDILVQFNKSAKKLRNLVGLAEFLESIFNAKVDLLTMDSLSPISGHIILNEVEYAAISG